MALCPSPHASRRPTCAFLTTRWVRSQLQSTVLGKPPVRQAPAAKLGQPQKGIVSGIPGGKPEDKGVEGTHVPSEARGKDPSPLSAASGGSAAVAANPASTGHSPRVHACVQMSPCMRTLVILEQGQPYTTLTGIICNSPVSE